MLNINQQSITRHYCVGLVPPDFADPVLQDRADPMLTDWCDTGSLNHWIHRILDSQIESVGHRITESPDSRPTG